MAFGKVGLQQRTSGVSLHDVESEVRRLIDTIATSRLRLCQCLGLIERHKLYVAIGAKDFKDYLTCQHIPIPYQTAQQYATIGHALEDQAEYLDSIGYSEADGLCKLRFLYAALQRHADPQDVAHHLKNDSFRQFRDYAKQIVAEPARADGHSEPGCHDDNGTGWKRVWFADDSIIVMTEDECRKEVVWFEPEAFDDDIQYQSFVQMIITLVEQVGAVR